MTNLDSKQQRLVESKPADFLKRLMSLYGLTAKSLATTLGVHEQTLYNITSRERDISPLLAEKLADHFGTAIKTWRTNPISVPMSQWESWVQDAAQLGKTTGKVKQPGPMFVNDVHAGEQRPHGSERTLIDTEIREMAEKGEGIHIDPFDPDQVQSASYDLTVGLIIHKGYRKLPEVDWVRLMKSELTNSDDKAANHDVYEKLKKLGADASWSADQITLKPDQSATVFAQEIVGIDSHYLAEVGPTASNAKKGLLVLHGFQVDPGYRGPMVVTIRNISSEEINLSQGQKLISLAFRTLVKPPEKTYRQAARKAVEKVIDAFRREFDARLKVSLTASTEEYLGLTPDGHIEAFGPTEDAVKRKIFDECLQKLDDEVAGFEVRDLLNTCMQHTQVNKEQASAVRVCLGIEDSESKERLEQSLPLVGETLSLKSVFNSLKANADDLVSIMHSDW